MSINGVTFDLWQTLIMDRPELGRSRMQERLDGTQTALSEAGEDFSEDRIQQAYAACRQMCNDTRTDGLDVGFMEQVGIFIRNIDSDLVGRLDGQVLQRIAKVYSDAFFRGPPPLHPDAKALLESMRAKGYAVGLISNTGMTPGVIFRAYLEEIGILKYFDALTFSDEVRISKPGKDIFLQACAALGVPLNQIVHVGDSLRNDAFGARQVGMKAIWIETQDERTTPPDVEPDVELDLGPDLEPDATVKSLGEVADAIGRIVAATP